jgi:hypothetical protein
MITIEVTAHIRYSTPLLPFPLLSSVEVWQSKYVCHWNKLLLSAVWYQWRQHFHFFISEWGICLWFPAEIGIIYRSIQKYYFLGVSSCFLARLPDSENKSFMNQGAIEAGNRALLVICFLPVSCPAYSSPLKMEVIRCYKMLVDFQLTTWRIPEDRTLQKCFKSYILWHVDLSLGGNRKRYNIQC